MQVSNRGRNCPSVLVVILTVSASICAANTQPAAHKAGFPRNATRRLGFDEVKTKDNAFAARYSRARKVRLTGVTPQPAHWYSPTNSPTHGPARREDSSPPPLTWLPYVTIQGTTVTLSSSVAAGSTFDLFCVYH